jgi:general secretion pathway protein F
MTGTAFRYHVIDRVGHRVQGREAAPTGAALAQALEARGFVVLDVAPAESSAPEHRTESRGSHKREILEVTRALAALLPAGLPLAASLTAARALASGPVAHALDDVRSRVERGERLASALSTYPKLFSPLYLGLVRAGERSGALAGAFARLATQLEREESLRAKLLSVSIYPLLLATAGGMAVLVLLFFVVPRFVELLQGTGALLPASTAALLSFSGALRRWWPVLAILPIALALVLAWARTAPQGQRAASATLLQFPGIGAMRRQALGARFARLLATLLGGGAPLLRALDDTIECLDDPLARDEIVRIRGMVREGASLHAALATSGMFPVLLAQLVAVGDESGRLHEFLLKAAEILEERTSRAVERLVALAEPGMIVLFGGAVGFVALSLLQAIYSVNAGSFR